MSWITLKVFVISLSLGLTNCDFQFKKTQNELMDPETIWEDFQGQSLMVSENDLLDILPNRLSNVGPTFILRDLVKAILTQDNGVRVTSWTLAVMGILAFISKTLATISTPQFSDDPGLGFLNATSQVLGVGVGVLAISGDLNDIFKSSRCLSNVKINEWSIRKFPVESDSSSTSMDMAMSNNPSDPMCGQYALLEYLGNLFSIGTDLVAIAIPPAGPYMAVIATLQTIATTAFRMFTNSDGFAWQQTN